MDIGIVCQKASTGGWRYALMLACALKQTRPGVRVTVHCRARRLPPGGLATLRAAGVVVARLPRATLPQSPWPLTRKRFTGLKAIDKGLNVLRQYWKVATRESRNRRLARSLASHDVVHFAWPYDLDPPPLTVPMSFIPHDFIYTHEFGVANYSRQDWLAARHAHERWLASATPIVSSDFIAGELRRTFPEYRGLLEVVYLSSLNPPPAEGIATTAVEEVCTRFDLPARFVLCPNNVMPHKNLAGVIAALWHVRQASDDVKLVVCGVETQGIRAAVTGPLYADRTESKTAWDVRGLGLVSDADVLTLMRAAALVINPSFCEAGSGSGLDAWGCGCPVAMSDIPAFRDQVGFLGTRAEFFDPRDPRDIARAILAILQNPDHASHMAETSRAAITSSQALAMPRTPSWSATDPARMHPPLARLASSQ
jgi:glycosyltransferase involved in cell wall biosynthesis